MINVKVQPLSRDAFQCTPVYIWMHPGEEYMAYASSFITGVKVLSYMGLYYTVMITAVNKCYNDEYTSLL